MRTAFLQTLTELMRKDKNLIAITADMGFSVFEELQKEFPKRFINTGVTEQASIGIATGFALSGHKVFFYAQAPFATMRCFEQIRLDVSYNNMDIKIVGVSAGFASNQLGVSHYAVEDVGLMRMLPEMTIFTPGDPSEAKWATKSAYSLSTPCYIRLTKAGSPIVHTHSFNPKIGVMVQVMEGGMATLFVSGSLLPMGKDIVELLHERNIEVALYSVPVVKPIDNNTIIETAKKTKAIFTLEEHSVIGGLGSAVAEIIAKEKLQVSYEAFGIPDKFTDIVGSPEYLLEYVGLSKEEIVKKIQLSLKKTT